MEICPLGTPIQNVDSYFHCSQAEARIRGHICRQKSQTNNIVILSVTL